MKKRRKCLSDIGATVQGAPSTFPVDYNAIGPAFRNAFYAGAMGFGWADPSLDEEVLQYASLVEKSIDGGRLGMYINEENAECFDGCKWGDEYWGSDHFQKLIDIKKKSDPNNVFWCKHCVGDA